MSGPERPGADTARPRPRLAGLGAGAVLPVDPPLRAARTLRNRVLRRGGLGHGCRPRRVLRFSPREGDLGQSCPQRHLRSRRVARGARRADPRFLRLRRDAADPVAAQGAGIAVRSLPAPGADRGRTADDDRARRSESAATTGRRQGRRDLAGARRCGRGRPPTSRPTARPGCRAISSGGARYRRFDWEAGSTSRRRVRSSTIFGAIRESAATSSPRDQPSLPGSPHW